MKMILLAFFTFAFAVVLEAQAAKRPTVTEAEACMKKAEARLAEVGTKVQQANWVHENFIPNDTGALAAAVNDENTAVTAELVQEAKRFEGLKMPDDLARKFLLLKL